MPMQRVFKTKTFRRWSRKAGISDEALCAAVAEMMQGLIDADLGGRVFKKRVPVPGRVNAAVLGRLSEAIFRTAGSSSTASRRRTARRSRVENSRRCRRSPPRY